MAAAPARIWIVDDSPLDAERAAAALAELGRCEVFVHGGTMLERLSTAGAPDLVILDWKLPDLDGLEVCRFLRQTHHEGALPILLITSFSSQEDLRDAFAAGVNDFVSKPFRPLELVARAGATLRNKQLFDRARDAEARAEREHTKLVESEAKFRRLSDAGVLAVLYMDLAGTILDANAAFLALIGRSQAELAAGRITMRDLTAPEDHWLDEKAYRGLAETGVVAQFEKTLISSSGERVVVLQGAALVDGARPRAIAFLLDISRQKSLEADRARLFESERKARASAEAANRMKDEFLATVSHELRTPLNSILGWSHVARTQSSSGPQLTKALDTIDRNARAQAKLIDDILDSSRIVSGKVRLEVADADLARVVEQAVDVVRPTATAKGVQVSVTTPPGGAPISGDADRLQQIVWNLLTNAIKFTPAQGRVSASLVAVTSGWQVTIEDSGAGIAPDFLPLVFDRFRQADGSTTRRQGGLGLGLAIVRHLTELHGGSVLVHSDGPGTGARFVVQLPARAPSVADPHPATPQPQGVTDAAGAPAVDALSGLRVLVVDDEPDARDFIGLALERHGAEVTAAASADEAFRTFLRRPPDVMLSDISMPGEDGYSLARRVRALPAAEGGEVPAIALTAHATPSEVARALAAGFQVHISKPVDPLKLVQVLADLRASARPG